MTKPILLASALAAAAFLCGCGNTLSGAKQDAASDTQKVQQGADQATQATKEGVQKAGQAVAVLPESAAANTVVRPAVKTAIIRDPVLAQSGNLINVNAGPNSITLTGHVTDASMKPRAAEDAQIVLKKHPGYTLTNELIVTAP